ncbi:MAG: DinB family protein [Holophagaceae bacterium]
MNLLQYPNHSQLSPYHRGYLDLLNPNTSLFTYLEKQRSSVIELSSEIYNAKGNFRYETGKWSLFEVLVHLIDWERIMLFRIMAISRDLGHPLPSLDQDHVMISSQAPLRHLEELLKDWDAARQSTCRFIESLGTQDLVRSAEVASYSISANDLCYVHVGHVAHHVKILNERYRGF